MPPATGFKKLAACGLQLEASPSVFQGERVKKPLKRIRVLDFTRVLAGPYCAMMLCDMGAEVIKVERPGTGDDARFFGPFIKGESGYYMSLNRGKKSIALNLKHKKGKEIVKKLIKKVDIVLENFRPGTMEKLGFGYQDIKKINPKIIYASTSGYGQTGPISRMAGYDIVAQAVGGIMSITGPPNGLPTRVGTSIADILAGMFTAYGVMIALYNRGKTGKGAQIDVAMVDSVASVLENAIIRYLATGKSPKPIGSRHPSLAPFDMFKAKDGYMVIAIGNEKLWHSFCQAIGRDDLLKDPRFINNKKRLKNERILKSLIERWTRKKTVKKLLVVFNELGIPCGPVNSMERMVRHPQILFRNMIQEIKHPVAGKIKMAGIPLKMAGFSDKIPGRSPLLGEHTEEILKKYLRYGPKRIKALKNEGVI
ncbi:CoA transferase [bacterium]|nr:CoA transferase [bacterium]